MSNKVPICRILKTSFKWTKAKRKTPTMGSHNKNTYTWMSWILVSLLDIKKIVKKTSQMLNKHVRCSSLKNLMPSEKKTRQKDTRTLKLLPDRKYDILFWAWDQTESIICVPNRTSKGTLKLNCWGRFINKGKNDFQQQ